MYGLRHHGCGLAGVGVVIARRWKAAAHFGATALVHFEISAAGGESYWSRL
jgi:hypothetical protein